MQTLYKSIKTHYLFRGQLAFACHPVPKLKWVGIFPSEALDSASDVSIQKLSEEDYKKAKKAQSLQKINSTAASQG